MANIYGDIPSNLPHELAQTLTETQNVRIERIISRGQASAEGFWFDQDRHEWVILLRGAARVRFEGDSAAIDLLPGDYLDLPAHKRHRVEWTDPDQPTVWLAVHYR
jgi:cupin 2 domain-containing protein